jgi:multicomponent Na+:H+ antiporter subunit C
VLLAIAIITGIVFAAGIYMMLRRSLVKLIVGLALIGHASNFIIFVSGGLTRTRAPIVPEGFSAVPQPHADPVPQALILTAIVISFALLIFLVTLVNRTWRLTGTDDARKLLGEIEL